MINPKTKTVVSMPVVVKLNPIAFDLLNIYEENSIGWHTSTTMQVKGGSHSTIF